MRAWRTVASSRGFSFPFCKSNDACHPELWEMCWTVISAVKNMWQFHLVWSNFDHFCQISLGQICRWCSWHNWISAPSSSCWRHRCSWKYTSRTKSRVTTQWESYFSPLAPDHEQVLGGTNIKYAAIKLIKIFFKYVKIVNSVSKGWERNVWICQLPCILLMALNKVPYLHLLPERSKPFQI